MSSSSHEDTKAQQQQTTTQTTDPALLGMLQGNYSTAQTNAAKLDQPYQGLLTAGFNPTQTQSQGILSAVAQDPSYLKTANSATSAVQGILGSPLNGNINAQTYDPSQLANTDLSKYMNPYTSSVIDATTAANERARQIAGVSNQQHATQAGAFGGSRAGVADSLTNGEYDRNSLSTIAGLNQANFTQAQTAAQGDVSAQNTAKQFNATQGQNAQQGSFANALAAQGLTLNAAGQLVQMNNNALNTATTQGGILSAVGDAQQQQSQTEINNAIANWQAGKQLTIQEQQLLNSALGLMPNQGTTTSSGTSSGSSDKTESPGVGGILSGLGSLGMGLGSKGLGLSMAGLSDERAKADVETLRHDGKGRRWVSFRYKWEPKGTRHEGVIAQEILATDPNAVGVGEDGLFRVDYSQLREAA